MDEALIVLLRSVLPVWQRHLDTARDHAEVAVAEMLSAFSAMQPALHRRSQPPETLDADTPVQQHVERMFVGLQYQDRISQMMALLADDLQRMQDTLAVPGADPQTVSSQQWLTRLESDYAMAAQRHAHSGTQDGTAATPAGSEPDFF